MASDEKKVSSGKYKKPRAEKEIAKIKEKEEEIAKKKKLMDEYFANRRVINKQEAAQIKAARREAWTSAQETAPEKEQKLDQKEVTREINKAKPEEEPKKKAAREAARFKVLVPIANEINALEAVVVIDVLRRAGAKVTVASVENDLQINASAEVKIVADEKIADCKQTVFNLIALPGGPGAKTLEDCETLRDMVIKHVVANRHCVAICDAPVIAFCSWGLSQGKKATCPSITEQLPSTTTAIESRAEKADIFTAAIELVEHLYGERKAKKISKQLIVGSNHVEEYDFTHLNPVDWVYDGIPKILVPVADGTEEMEVVIIVEVLRRAGANVVVASVEGEKKIVCSRNVKLEADMLMHEAVKTTYDLIVLPDELKGAKAFQHSKELIKLLHKQMESKKPYGAMCACPALILEHNGLLKGKMATVYPSCRGILSDQSHAGDRVVVDGCVATSQGIGCSLKYALVLVEKLYGREKAEKIAEAMAKANLVMLRSINAMASNQDSSSGLQFQEEISAPVVDSDEYMHLV